LRNINANLDTQITMKYIALTCSGREEMIQYLQNEIPNLVVSFDNFKDAGKFKSTSFYNARKGWKLAGNEASVFLEDDIVLCDNFCSKIEAIIQERPNEVIQFFSMRKKDISIGSRYESGTNFIMHQCYYLPSGMAQKVYEYSFEFEDACNYGEHIGPNDMVTQYYLKKNKIKYWLHVPSLVDHRQCKSMIDPRRSSKRQSLTFKK